MPGFVLWFTGLSGSGKSTLAALVATELRRRGVHVETLDGDEIRRNLSKGLGFSKEDRDVNVRRLGFVARLIARSGGCAITAAISPYRDVRDEVRQGVERFCEVFCDCPLSVLAKRDPKGLYDKAMRGELKNFTGVDDPYEAPLNAEVHLKTDSEAPSVSAERIVNRLLELGFIETAVPSAKTTLPAPYGGDMQVRLVSPSSLDAPGPTLDAESEPALVALGLGLLSPLRGFMSSREIVKVRREQHLERGLAWPSPVVLPVDESVAVGGSVGLYSASRQRLATLDVVEVWSDGGRRYAAGEVRVERLPAWASSCRPAPEVRADLEARGSVVAFPLFELPNLGDEHLARSVLEVGEHLLLVPVLTPRFGEKLLQACQLLARQYLDTSRVSIAPVPAPPTGSPTAGLLGIFAQNLGASRLLLSQRYLQPAASQGPHLCEGTSLAISVHVYTEPCFDERLGAFVSAAGGGASAAGLERARTRRAEIAALERSTA